MPPVGFVELMSPTILSTFLQLQLASTDYVPNDDMVVKAGEGVIK